MEQINNIKSLTQVRSRNWQKARLLGFCIDTTILTEEEKIVYSEIKEKLFILKRNWDINTAKFLGHPLKPHKCNWCGKRSNVTYLYKEQNFCKKCFKTYE